MKVKYVFAKLIVPLLVLTGLFALVVAPAMAVHALVPAAPAVGLTAQATAPQFQVILTAMLIITAGFASLLGVSKLNGALVNLLKLIPGLVKDGTSANWAAGLNLVAFCLLVYFKVFRPDLSLDVLDGFAGQIAAVVIFIFGFIVQMTGSKSAHEDLKAAGVPLFSKSYSG